MSLNKFKALLVDDEFSALNNLSVLLNEFCPTIEVIGKVRSVDEAIEFIGLEKPDVIFLDIEMPKKSGFELFKYTKENFQTIFITAYDNYAIKAFEVSALDYLLKPIHIDRLQQAVAKINRNHAQNQQIESLQQNINADKIRKINIPYRDVYKVLSTDNIICIEAKQAYSVIHYVSDKTKSEYIYSKNLRYFENLFEEDTAFLRVHRSWLVNIDFVENYSSKTAVATLKFGIKVSISRRKLKQFQNVLK